MEDKDNLNKTFQKAKDATVDFGKAVGEKVKDIGDKVSNEVIELIDENGNGKIDLIDFVIKALRTPGVNVNRNEYLENSFKKYCNNETVSKMLTATPAKAGISKEIADIVANDSIKLQKSIVTTTSIGLGYVPGGVGVDAATTVADITQYYGNLLIVMQKLMYIYGYPELDLTKENGSIDDGTLNLIICGLGAMAGVKEASKLLTSLTAKLAENAPKQILKTGFSTKIAYQVSKKVLGYFGVRLTKDVAAKGISNAIKFVGGLIMGGITFATFSESCNRFKDSIKDTPLSDPNYVDKSNVIDAEITNDELEEELEKEIGPIEDSEESD